MTYWRCHEYVLKEMIRSGEWEGMTPVRVMLESDVRGQILEANQRCKCDSCGDMLEVSFQDWLTEYDSRLAMDTVQEGCKTRDAVYGRRVALGLY
jgi:hypothetical protein